MCVGDRSHGISSAKYLQIGLILNGHFLQKTRVCRRPITRADSANVVVFDFATLTGSVSQVDYTGNQAITGSVSQVDYTGNQVSEEARFAVASRPKEKKK